MNDQEKPHELSERNLFLAREYRHASMELGRLKRDRAVKWLEIRKECKTDKEADNRWAATTEGQRELELTYLCKGYEKEMSAVKAHLRTLDVFGYM